MMRTPVAFDTETGLITPRDKAPPLVCLTYALPSGSTGLLGRHDAGRFLEIILRDQSVQIVTLNGGFDFCVMLREHPRLTSLVWQAYSDGRVTDIGIRQKLIDLELGIMDHTKRPSPFRVGKSAYSLAALAKRHLGLDLAKGEDTWRLRYSELRDVPVSEWPTAAREYAIKDAEVTLGAFLKQFDGKEVSPDECAQVRHDLWLKHMSVWGMATDVPRAQKLASKFEAELVEIRKLLIADKLLRVERKKGQQVLVRDQKVSRAFMAEACASAGVEAKLTKKGSIALDVEACELSGHPTLKAYAQYVHLQGLLTKNIPVFLRGECHASFNSLLETGRTSSYNDKIGGGDNVQNPPRKGGARECFRAREGTWLVDADYCGLELSTMAQACLQLIGRSKLADLINSGRDPHLETAAGILGISYSAMHARYEQHDKWKKGEQGGVQDDEAANARNLAKPCNFGFPGGMAAKTFVDFCAAMKMKMPLELAYRLREVWQQAYPEFPEAYFPRHKAMTAGGMLAVCESIKSGRVRGGCKYTVLNNNYFQSLGADCAKDAGWHIARACYDPAMHSPLYGARPVNFIHDQFLVEITIATAAEGAAEVGRLMNQAGKRWMPDVSPTTVPALSRCWSKDAVAVHDANGRLTVWEEKRKEEKPSVATEVDSGDCAAAFDAIH